MASAVIGSLRVNLGIDTAAFGNGLKQAGSALSGFGGILRKAIVPLAAVGTAAAVGMGAAVKSTIDAADEMSKAASKFGVPIEELSRLKYAADLSDVSLSTLGTSLGALSKNMVKAATGAGPMAEAFAAAGIAVKNADGTLRSTSDVLADLSDKFLAMPDGAEKTALAMQLMGKSGKEMIPLLQGGSKALAEAQAEASKFGQVFTAETGKGAEQFNDNLTRLGGTFNGLSIQLTERLLPTLVQFTDWLVANGPELAARAGDFIEFGAKVVAAISTIGPALDLVSDAMHAVVAGIAEAVTAGTNFANQMSDAMHSVVEAIAGKVEEIRQTFAALRDSFVQIGRDLIAGLWQGITEKWESLKATARSIASSVTSIFRGEWGVQSPSTVFAEIGRNLMQGLSGGLVSMQGQVEGEVQSFASSLSSTFAGVLTGATDFRSALSSILSDVGSSLINAGIGNIFGAMKIPGFAGGTMSAPGGLAWVGEHGRELVNMPRGSQVIPNHDLGNLGGATTINVNVAGANGDAHVMALVQQGVVQGLGAYDQTLPGRVRNISQDPRRRS